MKIMMMTVTEQLATLGEKEQFNRHTHFMSNNTKKQRSLSDLYKGML